MSREPSEPAVTESDRAIASMAVRADHLLSVYQRASIVDAIGRVETKEQLFELLAGNGIDRAEAGL